MGHSSTSLSHGFGPPRFFGNRTEKEGRRLFQDDYSSEQCCSIAREFLERNGLWMIDVLNRYERRPGRETSALDSDIVPPKPEDFLELRPIFASCRSLRKIAFTSQQAARWTFDALFQQQLAEKFSFSKTLEAWRSYPDENKYVRPVLSSSVLEIGVSFFILPSPSSSGRSAVPYEIIKQAYRTVLFSCRDL